MDLESLEEINLIISNHTSDLEKRVKRLEKFVLIAIITNLPQLIEIIFP